VDQLFSGAIGNTIHFVTINVGYLSLPGRVEIGLRLVHADGRNRLCLGRLGP
jgi:hypothetical protein